ncbi:MAG TPA: cupin domain-containing protein [Streptosporangiaceae bacterium]|nr:cupin domain-containing protein [Streptosporangiaceae bacterium]
MSQVPVVVVQAAEVAADECSAGAAVRTLVDTSADEPGLVRRLVDVAPGAALRGSAGAGGELWFVIEGTGTLELTGQPDVALRPDRGFLMPPGWAYLASASQETGLRLDTVSLPAGHGVATGTPLSCDFADCEVETTGDRKFRVLFGPGRDCSVATQFVGEIPPGRAPDHSHPYDEVVLVLQGQGVAHIGGTEHALSAGTCAHLPPGLVHCLENTGSQMLRVLGVFHPADSPAAKLEEH